MGRLSGSQKDDVKPHPLPVPERLLAGCEHSKSSPTGKFLFGRIMRAFVEAIESGTDAVPNFYDGMKTQEVMQAVQDSSAGKQWVAL